jgi:hypothetical protein
MNPSPRVLLTLDYEPWFALTRRFDSLADLKQRRDLDGGYVLSALDPILEKLGDAKVSFYLVGEIAEWYPEIPQKIVDAGHELGLHCQTHRHLDDVKELTHDVKASTEWRKKYNVRGYRAPMIGISEEAYPMLEAAGFLYSSSIYAPAGTLIQKNKMWEVPASTFPLFGKQENYQAPRRFSMRLLLGGEIPYGSSLVTGMMGWGVLKMIEHELNAGRSPVIFLHPYELVAPSNWPNRLLPDLMRNPLLWPFTWNKSGFLKTLLKNFPVSSVASYLNEVLSQP